MKKFFQLVSAALFIVTCILTASVAHAEDAATYYNHGNAYYNQQQYERAIQDYDKAIEINPNFAQAYNNRGIAYHPRRKPPPFRAGDIRRSF